MGLPRSRVEADIRVFNEWYDAQTHDIKAHYAGRSGIYDYDHCSRCHAPYTEMKLAIEGQVPRGVTIQPVLLPPELEKSSIVDSTADKDDHDDPS
jgi:hypothetical protein